LILGKSTKELGACCRIEHESICLLWPKWEWLGVSVMVLPIDRSSSLLI
jgi:hypothetical protein